MINSPTVLAALAPPSPAPNVAGSSTTTWPRLPRRGLKRPRGLWKARRRLDAAPGPGLNGQQQQQHHQLLQTPKKTTMMATAAASSSGRGYDTEEEEREMMLTESGGEGFSEEDCGEEELEEEDDMSQDSGSSKRQRRESRSGSCGSAELIWAAVYVDTSLGLTLPTTDKRRSASASAEAVTVADPGSQSRSALGTSASTSTSTSTSTSVSGGAGSALAGASGVLPAVNVIGRDGGGATAAARDPARPCRRRRASRALISDMITTSLAENSSNGGATQETFEYDDWEKIKETLSRASELCDRDDTTNAIPLLRAVIHASHRFLIRFPDPSVFFSRPRPRRDDGDGDGDGSSSPDSGVMMVMREESVRPWDELGWSSSRRKGSSRMSTSPSPSLSSSSPEPDFSFSEHRTYLHRRNCIESPTAVHTVLGVALFLFGNIIARDPSLSLGTREPTSPSPYWLASLDAFNAGDNLPCQIRGEDITITSSDTADATGANDWRAAIAWGRALVALAYEATTKKQQQQSPTTARPSLLSSSHSSSTTVHQSSTPPRSTPRSRTQTITPVPTRYHPRSPLAAISALRTASGACGGSLGHVRATASELLTLASDQFTRGIFHMPHVPSATHAAAAVPRQQVLYTLATEVLAVAERLEDVAARSRWAAWADALLLQMHMEADVDAWRVRVGVARGRCWLVIGAARADEMEDALERGEVGVLMSKEAEEARVGLNTAISFFDRAKGSASTESSDKSLMDMQPLLAEALITLANLTADEDTREALYARAQIEGGDAVARELGPIRMARSRAATIVVRMDVS